MAVVYVNGMGAIGAPGLSNSASSVATASARKALGLQGGAVALGRVKPRPAPAPLVVARAVPRVPARTPALVTAHESTKGDAAAVVLTAPPPAHLGFGRIPVPVTSDVSGGGGGAMFAPPSSLSLAPDPPASDPSTQAGAPSAAAPTPTGYYVAAGVLALALGVGLYVAVR